MLTTLRGVALRVACLLAVCAFTSVASAETVRVTADRSTIWRTPTGTGGVLTIVAAGTKLEVRGRQGRWLIVEDPSDARRTGYILESQTEATDGGPTVARPTAPEPARPATAEREPRQVPPTAGSAPTRRASTKRSFLLLNGAVSPDPVSLTTSQEAFGDIYQEAGSISTRYGAPPRAFVHGLFGASFGALGIGGGALISRNKGAAEVTAVVPSPFLFDRHRSTTATSDSLGDLEAEFQVPIFLNQHLGRTGILTVFGGPSLFFVSRTLVSSVTVNDSYPFTSTAIAEVQTERRSGNAFGGHVGIEAFWGRRVAVGGGVLYSKGTVNLSGGGELSADQRAGDLRYLLGIRTAF